MLLSSVSSKAEVVRKQSGVMFACEVVGWYIKPHVVGTCA